MVSMTKFRIGDCVCVGERQPTHHVRTPSYVRGKRGIIVAHLGAFRNPEELAYGADGLPMRYLYHVSFRQTDLWPDYSGRPQDTSVVEIFEHWLEPVGQAQDTEINPSV